MNLGVWWAGLSTSDKTAVSVGAVTAVATVVSVGIFAITELRGQVSAMPSKEPVSLGSVDTPAPSPAPICKNRRDPSSHLSGRLIVGINGRLPGWSKGRLATSGEVLEPRGFDVDLIKFIAGRHGFEVNYRAVTPLGREDDLANCRVHLVLANYSMTARRDAGYTDSLGRVVPAVDFAGPYFHDQSGVLCAPSKFACGTGTPIPQQKICVVRGTEAEGNLREAQKADINYECLERLHSPQSDVVAYSTDKTILEAYEDSVGSVSTIVWTSTPDKPISEEFYGIGLPDDSSELCKVLSQDIDDFLKVGGAWDQAFLGNLKGQNRSGRNPGGSQSRWCRV